MSKFGVWLVETINRIFPAPRNLRELDSAKSSLRNYQQWEITEAERNSPEFGSRWDLENKTVLDIGCGLGGKLQYYAGLGPRNLFAIDIRLHSAREARSLSQEFGNTNAHILLTDAAHMAFPSNSFDVIVSVNVFEHIEDLTNTMYECQRILRPGGLMFLHFPPFYSPWGAHLEGWVNFPWPHVFFSDRTLIEVANRVENKQQHNKEYIPTAQVHWDRLDRLPELNRTTASQFYKLIKQVNLHILEAQMLPFGRHYLQKHGGWGKITLALLKWLAMLPLLREVITTKMVFVLTKDSQP